MIPFYKLNGLCRGGFHSNAIDVQKMVCVTMLNQDTLNSTILQSYLNVA